MNIPAKSVPRLLSNKQKVIVFLSVQQGRDDTYFISSIIIGDAWINDYDSKTKQQSSQWKLTNSQSHTDI